MPDPEVNDRAHRRTFTAAYKLRVVQEADACTDPGQIGALLRREGLYHSHLAKWRKQRLKGEQQALAPQKRGRKPAEKNPLAEEVARLQRENSKLEEKLRRAHLIIDVQKKLSEILGLPMAENSEDVS
jgi:transposase-like protein